MSYHSFPAINQLLPIKRRPVWSTLKQRSMSGRETRVPLWSYPQWHYEVKSEALRTAPALAEFQQLVGLFNSLAGSAGMFVYTDPTDSVASAQPFGVGDGATTQFQLVRSLGGFAEPVFAPLTVAISGQTTAGTSAISSAGYTVGATGLISFTTPPAAGTTLLWTGTFGWLCQFDDDEMDLQQDFATIWSAGLKFTTVKL